MSGVPKCAVVPMMAAASEYILLLDLPHVKYCVHGDKESHWKLDFKTESTQFLEWIGMAYGERFIWERIDVIPSGVLG